MLGWRCNMLLLCTHQFVDCSNSVLLPATTSHGGPPRDAFGKRGHQWALAHFCVMAVDANISHRVYSCRSTASTCHHPIPAQHSWLASGKACAGSLVSAILGGTFILKAEIGFQHQEGWRYSASGVLKTCLLEEPHRIIIIRSRFLTLSDSHLGMGKGCYPDQRQVTQWVLLEPMPSAGLLSSIIGQMADVVWHTMVKCMGQGLLEFILAL